MGRPIEISNLPYPEVFKKWEGSWQFSAFPIWEFFKKGKEIQVRRYMAHTGCGAANADNGLLKKGLKKKKEFNFENILPPPPYRFHGRKEELKHL